MTKSSVTLLNDVIFFKKYDITQNNVITKYNQLTKSELRMRGKEGNFLSQKS